METEPVTQKSTPILEIAWTHFAELDLASLKRSKAHINLRRWIAVFGILAALFAILSQMLPTAVFGVTGWIVRLFLILTPLIASLLATIASKNFASGDWLITRAGAEEIRKEIYLFRTAFQKTDTRRADLEKKLERILRQVFRSLGGELTMDSYGGPLPNVHDPNDPLSDPGFHDLTGEEYFNYRLVNQLDWHTAKLKKYQAERGRLQWIIGISGVIGALLAALGEGWAIWVALSSSITTAFIGWQQLRNLDAIIRNFSKVRNELSLLRDHWVNLEQEERTPAEFYQMAKSTEDILWSQNVEYIKSQQEALKDASLEEEASLLNNVIQKAVDTEERTKKAIADRAEAFATNAIDRAGLALEETFEHVLTSLEEEANSEVVRAELEAMGQAITEAAGNIIERATSRLSTSLQAIADEFKEVEISRDTPPDVLNQIMSRYPKSNEVKG